MTIHDELTAIEKRDGVKILFAVEAGSRLWRIESNNSDFDVRFVYIRPLDQYLLIHPLRDVIEHKKDNQDYVGFDLYKFVRLLINSNPSVIEWLLSDIIYINDETSHAFLRKWIMVNCNPIALYQHYRSMCKSNYFSYLHSDKEVTYKKYLYAMRGLVNAKWVEQTMSIPPIKFVDTLMEIDMPDDIVTKLLEIIEIKKKAEEKTYISHIQEFESYIEEFLKNMATIEPRRTYNIEELQDFIWRTLW